MKELRSLKRNRTIHSVDAAALVANEAGGVVLLIEKMSSCLAGLKEVTVENSKNDGKLEAGRAGDRPSRKTGTSGSLTRSACRPWNWRSALQEW